MSNRRRSLRATKPINYFPDDAENDDDHSLSNQPNKKAKTSSSLHRSPLQEIAQRNRRISSDDDDDWQPEHNEESSTENSKQRLLLDDSGISLDRLDEENKEDTFNMSDEEADDDDGDEIDTDLKKALGFEDTMLIDRVVLVKLQQEGPSNPSLHYPTSWRMMNKDKTVKFSFIEPSRTNVPQCSPDVYALRLACYYRHFRNKVTDHQCPQQRETLFIRQCQDYSEENLVILFQSTQTALGEEVIESISGRGTLPGKIVSAHQTDRTIIPSNMIGIYTLVGYNQDDQVEMVYIGQSLDMRLRFIAHGETRFCPPSAEYTYPLLSHYLKKAKYIKMFPLANIDDSQDVTRRLNILEALWCAALGTCRTIKNHQECRATFSLANLEFIGGNSTPCMQGTEVKKIQSSMATDQTNPTLNHWNEKLLRLIIQIKATNQTIRFLHVPSEQKAAKEKLVVLTEQLDHCKQEMFNEKRDLLLNGEMEVRINMPTTREPFYYQMVFLHRVYIPKPLMEEWIKCHSARESKDTKNVWYVTLKLVDGTDYSKDDALAFVPPRFSSLFNGIQLYVKSSGGAWQSFRIIQKFQILTEPTHKMNALFKLLPLLSQQRRLLAQSRFEQQNKEIKIDDISISNLLNGRAYAKIGKYSGVTTISVFIRSRKNAKRLINEIRIPVNDSVVREAIDFDIKSFWVRINPFKRNRNNIQYAERGHTARTSKNEQIGVLRENARKAELMQLEYKIGNQDWKPYRMAIQYRVNINSRFLFVMGQVYDATRPLVDEDELEQNDILSSIPSINLYADYFVDEVPPDIEPSLPEQSVQIDKKSGAIIFSTPSLPELEAKKYCCCSSDLIHAIFKDYKINGGSRFAGRWVIRKHGHNTNDYQFYIRLIIDTEAQEKSRWVEISKIHPPTDKTKSALHVIVDWYDQIFNCPPESLVFDHPPLIRDSYSSVKKSKGTNAVIFSCPHATMKEGKRKQKSKAQYCLPLQTYAFFFGKYQSPPRNLQMIARFVFNVHGQDQKAYQLFISLPDEDNQPTQWIEISKFKPLSKNITKTLATIQRNGGIIID